MRTAIAVPPALARRDNRVLRPRDAADVYAFPRQEFARLIRLGALARIAPGYAALVPQHRLGDKTWRPNIAAVALGIGQADYGTADVALSGISAARHHGAIPRAISIAVVTVPKQRPALPTAFGKVVFVKRAAALLDLERVTTELATGWVTTVEQTLLDLADRPTLGGLDAADVGEAVRALALRADWDLVMELAARQHKPAALRDALTLAGRADADL